MAKYCVNRDDDHEVHKMSCNHLPEENNRKYFDAESDEKAMQIAKVYFPYVDGCEFCMPKHHKK